MALANRLLNVVILVMALVAVVFSWKLWDRRKELRERGDALANFVSGAATDLDENSAKPIGPEVKATENGAKGALGWEAFHADSSKYRGLLDRFQTRARDIRKMRDDLSGELVKVGAKFDNKNFDVPGFNDPDKSAQMRKDLMDHLTTYYERDKFLVKSLKGFNELLDPQNFDWDEAKLMARENYVAAEAKVTEGIKSLQDYNRRYADTLSQAVAKLGGEERLGVTAERIREVKPADIESMLRGIEIIMTTVKEVENLRAQLKVVNDQLAKAKDDLDAANEELSKHMIKIEQQTKVIEGQKAKISDLEHRISAMTNGGRVGGPLVNLDKFDGVVMKVNYDYSYVIIDIGGKDQLVYGTQLAIARDREFICNVMVTKVYQKYAVADIVPENKQGEVLEGDRVIGLQ